MGESFVALDLEYDLFNPRLWLIGLYLVDAGRREHIALSADDPSSERANLERMFELLYERAGLPIVTWGGKAADFPQLRSACKRLGLSGMLGLDDMHIDLFSSVRQILRLPIPDFGLAEVAAFFGVAKRSSIGDGREAQMLFTRYLSTYSASKRKRAQRRVDRLQPRRPGGPGRDAAGDPEAADREGESAGRAIATIPRVYTFLAVLQILIAVIVIFLVLLHSGKDAGLSGAFGIGGGGSSIGGGSMVERNLDRATIFFSILFVLNTFVLLKI